MRATNHHGRGTAKHASRHGYTAPHIDKARSKDNRFWTWCGGVRETDADGACPGLEGDERLYYSSMFRKGIEAQNEIYRKRRQYGKVRTPDDFYARRVTQPEESLLYIGDKSFRGAVSPDVLWDCVREYVAWEREFSRAHGDFYVPLSLSLHADERGQWHVHERGVYQYADGAGNLRIGQAAALEAAGFPLPDPDADRSVDNNRKMTWDAARREKWLDVVAAHGFQVEREPEEARPHMGLEAWQAWRDSMAEAEAVAGRAAVALQEAQEARREAQAEREAVRAVKTAQGAIADAIGTGILRRKRREAEARQDREDALKRQEAELVRREADVAAREAALDVVGRDMLRRRQEAQQRRQEGRARARVADGDRMLDSMGPAPLDVPDRGPEGR